MHQTNLRGTDLNLLVVLDALLDERSVTRAAARLGMSQPAASRALARLRAQFADPLLVDGPGGYLLSARAEAIRPALAAVLDGVTGMLRDAPFDPATATGRIRLLMPDLQATVLMPGLLARLAAEAPGLDLEIAPVGPDPLRALEDKAADAIVGLIEDAPPGIHRRRLYEEGLVTLMRAGHPMAGQPLTLEGYLALGHIVVGIAGPGRPPVDEALTRMGLQRRTRMRVPNFLVALELAARTDLVVTLPETLRQVGPGMDRFQAADPPLPLPRFAMSLAWHARDQNAPRHVWLRQAVVAATASALPAGG